MYFIIEQEKVTADDADDTIVSGISADDTLTALVAGEGPCSIDEISPDVVCDEQTENIFNCNSPKDIINGVPSLGSLVGLIVFFYAVSKLDNGEGFFDKLFYQTHC